MQTATLTTRALKLSDKSLFISLIVPVFNEQANIERFVAELSQFIQAYTTKWEIIVVDDGSSDNSAALIAALPVDLNVKLLVLSRNFGKETALSAGLDHCNGDVAIIIDADFQHPFTTIPEFLAQWSQGFDSVYGVRTDRNDESWFKKTFSNLFYRLSIALNEVSIPPHAGDFRLLDRKVIEALKKCPEHNRFMKGLYAWVGFKSIAVPFTVQERAAGKSSWNYRRLLGLALNGIFSFSNLPLRIWGLVGLIISSVAFAYALWIVFKVLFFGIDVPGYSTIVVGIMFFGGIQLLSIGILGEYIGRIFTEVKRRPNYLVAEKKGFEDDALRHSRAGGNPGC